MMLKKVLKGLASVLVLIVLWIILSCTFTMLTSGLDKMEKDFVVTAHRGGAGYGPENSLSTIARALENGAKSIEVDVHLSNDGSVVVCHDNKVDRTTNGKGYISEMSIEELRTLRLVNKNGDITEEQLPLLSEVLNLLNGKAHLLLEIKRYKDTLEGLEYAVVDLIRKFNAEKWITVQSFSDETLKKVRQFGPEIQLEKLAYCKIIGLPLLFDGNFRYFSYSRYESVSSFNFFYGGVSQSFVDELHSNGKKVRLWTVNKVEKLPNLDVDGIITDYPDLMQSLKDQM